MLSLAQTHRVRPQTTSTRLYAGGELQGSPVRGWFPYAGAVLGSPNAHVKASKHIHTSLLCNRAPGKPSLAGAFWAQREDIHEGFPGGAPTCQYRRLGFHPWVGKIPWRRERLPTPVFLPGESPWTEEPVGVQSMGLHRLQYD